MNVRLCAYLLYRLPSYVVTLYITRACFIQLFYSVFCFSFHCSVAFLIHACSRFDNLCLLWLFSLVHCTEGNSGYNIYLYMGVSYCYLIVCWSSVLIPFHSNPTCPEPDPWKVGGNYSGVQDLSFRTSARSPPFAGFAILSVFHQMEMSVSYTSGTVYLLRKNTFPVI